jgi:hypothetical protein
MSERDAAKTWVDVMIHQVDTGYPRMMSSILEFTDKDVDPVDNGRNILIGVCFFLGLIAIRNTQDKGPAPRLMFYSEQDLVEMMGEHGSTVAELSNRLWDVCHQAVAESVDPVMVISQITLGMLQLVDIDDSGGVNSRVSNRILLTAMERWLVAYSVFWKQVADQVEITHF